MLDATERNHLTVTCSYLQLCWRCGILIREGIAVVLVPCFYYVLPLLSWLITSLTHKRFPFIKYDAIKSTFLGKMSTLTNQIHFLIYHIKFFLIYFK